MPESDELKAKLKEADPDLQEYVAALKAENAKLHKRIFKLEAENVSLENRIAAIKEHLPPTPVPTKEDAERQLAELADAFGYGLVKKQ